MDSEFNWIRQIRLTLEGLPGGRKEYVADGSMNNLRISARIHKQQIIGNPAQIMIWNLSPDTRSAIADAKTKIKIKVEACWRDGDHGNDWNQYFYGKKLNAESNRSGEDIVTTIFALSELQGSTENTYQRTWRGTSVKSAVIELARCLDPENVTCSYSDVVGVDSFFSTEQGWCANGLVSDSLNSLAKEFGFSWYVDDGKFKACHDRKAFQRVITLREPKLISVNGIYATNMQFLQGVSWVCSLENMTPFDRVKIESSLPENRYRYKDDYRITEVSHDLDSHSKRSFVTSGTAFVHMNQG